MPTSGPRYPARFDPKAWETDLARSTVAAREAAQAARREYQASGVPREHLLRCDPEGREGNSLPNCLKVRVPHPNGKWGIVFRAALEDGRLELRFLAFGVRHHPGCSHARDLYDIAGARVAEVIARDLRNKSDR